MREPVGRESLRHAGIHAGRYVATKEISLAVSKVLGRYKTAKHLQLTIEEDRFDWQRKPASIRAGSGSGWDLCDSHQHARE